METYVKIRPFAFGPYDVQSGTNPQVRCRDCQFFLFLFIFDVSYIFDSYNW